jgi:phosphate/sulfate permease
MNIGKGIFGGALGGLAGAVIWAVISCFTGYEIGWIAWIVGGMVGFGCLWASKGCSKQLGVIAVVITLLSILAGKYAAVEFSIHREIGSEQQVLQNALEDLKKDEVVISYIADEIIQQLMAKGENIQWPSGVNPQEASEQSDYPPAIWSQASSAWEGMSPQEKEKYRAELAEFVQANIQTFFSEVSSYGFLHSFSPMDLLFFALAVATAYKIAGRGTAKETEPESQPDANTEPEQTNT